MKIINLQVLKLGLAAVILLGTLALGTQISESQLIDAQNWLENLGWIGLAVIFAGIVVVTPFGLPVTPFIILASALYGPLPAFIVAMLGQAISAWISFTASRRWLHPEFDKWLGDKPLITRMNNMIDKFGELTVLLMRVSLVFPFTLTNYALGLSNIPFRMFFIWTVTGIAPATLFYAVGTGVVKELFTDGTLSWQSGLTLGFSASLLIGAVITARIMMKKRNAELP